MSEHEKTSLMSKQRIEALSDNVFSIVMTLLVFSFKAPKLTGPNFESELYEKLLHLLPNFLSFGFSFTLICMFWVSHHALFRSIKHSNTKLLWINNFFLLWLAFIPFPSQVMGDYPEYEPSVIFYGAAMTMASLSFSLLRYYVYFLSDLPNINGARTSIRRSIFNGLLGPVLYIIAIVVSAFSKDVTFTMYALIPFLFLLPVNAPKPHEPPL